MVKAELVNSIKEVLDSFGESFEYNIETKEDGSTIFIGPYPSFLIFVNPFSEDGFMVSVNADAPNVTFWLLQLVRAIPELQHFGPYGELIDTGDIVFGEEAYDVKRQMILIQAMQLSEMAKQEDKTPEIYVPSDSGIIIPGGLK